MDQKKPISWIYIAVSVLVTAGVISLLLYKAGWERLIVILANTDPLFLVVALMVYAVSWYFRTIRLRQLLPKTGNPIKKLDLFCFNVSGFSLNTILPARIGEVAMIGYFRMEGLSFGESTAVIVQSRLLDLMALTSLILVSIPFISEHGMPPWLSDTLYVSGAIIVSGFIVGLWAPVKKLGTFFSRQVDPVSHPLIGKLVSLLGTVYEAYVACLSDRGRLAATFAVSILIWCLECVSSIFVCNATGLEMTVVPVVFTLAVANLGKAVPTTIGGIGVYESIFAGILVSFGVAFDIALVTAIIDHLLKKAFTLGFGLPATFRLMGPHWGHRVRFLHARPTPPQP